MSTGPSVPEQGYRRRRRREHPARYLIALLLALLGHGLFVGLLALVSYIQLNLPFPPPPPKPPSAVALRPLSAQDWAKNRGQVPKSNSSQVTPPVEKKKEPKEKNPKGQVVDVAPGNEQEAPDAKFLAEHDNKVEKETRAKEQTPFYRNAMPKTTAREEREGSGLSEETGQLAGNGGRGADDRPMREGGKKQAFELPDIKSRQELALKQDPNSRGPGMEVPNNRSESEALEGNSKRLRVQQDNGADDEGSEGRAGGQGLAKLMPSQAVMDQIVGGAPNDHLKDVEEGEGTYLNTREWKYASFFNRVKQRVGTQWNPNATLMRRDPTGNIYTGRDRYTLLSITLDEDGRVASITVEKSCGLDFLDLEAVESFKRAQPFPNPPQGLLEDDSKVRFQFGFFMEMGGGPKMRLFRQP